MCARGLIWLGARKNALIADRRTSPRNNIITPGYFWRVIKSRALTQCLYAEHHEEADEDREVLLQSGAVVL